MKKNQFCRKSAFRKRENFSVFFLFAVFRQFSEIIWKTVEEKKTTSLMHQQDNVCDRKVVDRITFSRKKLMTYMKTKK